MAEHAAGLKVDGDRGERLRFSDAEVVVRASADTTGGAFTIIETEGTIGPEVYATVSERYGITWLD
jgi:hypothetical protein